MKVEEAIKLSSFPSGKCIETRRRSILNNVHYSINELIVGWLIRSGEKYKEMAILYSMQFDYMSYVEKWKGKYRNG